MNSGDASSASAWGASGSTTAAKQARDPDCHVARDGRFVYFCSPINFGSAFELMNLLREAEAAVLADVKAATKATMALNHKHAKITCDPEPVVLTITTCGGGVHAAFAVVDAIASLAVPVHTVIAGYCASAGTLLHLAGARRFMGRNALAMLHEVRSAQWGKYSDLRDGFENTQQIMDQIIDYYVERTKIPREDLKLLLARDKNWSPQECLEKGVIDEILKPKKSE